MVDIDEKEIELLARIVAEGVSRLRGSQARVANRLARLGLLRAIAARRRGAPPYFVASGAGIAALNERNRVRDLRQGRPERRGAPDGSRRGLELDYGRPRDLPLAHSGALSRSQWQPC